MTLLKCVPDDIFTTQLQPGESIDTPVNIVVGTNTNGVNTRGVAHHIGNEYNAAFHELLKGKSSQEVALGTVLSGEGVLDGYQKAVFHAIAVNKRLKAGGPQDWTELLGSLKTGLEHLNLTHGIHDDGQRSIVDAQLKAQVDKLEIGDADYALNVKRLTDAHLSATRKKFRVVLIGGGDGQLNDADLKNTIQALEETDLMVHLYLGHGAQVAQAVRRVISEIPVLRDRELMAAA